MKKMSCRLCLPFPWLLLARVVRGGWGRVTWSDILYVSLYWHKKTNGSLLTAPLLSWSSLCVSHNKVFLLFKGSQKKKIKLCLLYNDQMSWSEERHNFNKIVYKVNFCCCGGLTVAHIHILHNKNKAKTDCHKSNNPAGALKGLFGYTRQTDSHGLFLNVVPIFFYKSQCATSAQLTRHPITDKNLLQYLPRPLVTDLFPSSCLGILPHSYAFSHEAALMNFNVTLWLLSH